MIGALDLMERYRRLTATPPAQATINETGESISILHQTKWIRILLIRRVAIPELISIEVELSLPSVTSDSARETTKGFNHGEPLSEDTSVILSDMIPHLQYMLRLKDVGFALDVIENNCMWIVTKSFNRMPDDDLFQLLVPPK